MTCRTKRIIILAMAAACVVPRGVLARTYYVRPQGNDQADGTSAGTAFKTILRAAQALNHGDSIVIGPGVYRESVLFAERFSADGSAMSVVGDESGDLTGAAAGAVVVEAAGAAAPALHFYRFNNLRIAGLTIRGPGQGIKLEKSSDVLVERSTFDGLTRGLIASGVQGLRVESCVFSRCTIGTFLHGSLGTRVAHVTVAGSSSVGVLALGCGQGEIRNSIFADNNTNLIADAISAPAWSSDCNVITGTNGVWGPVPAIAKVYEWSAPSGQDRHSVYVVPGFVDPERYDLHISPTVAWGGGLPGMNVGRRLDPPVELDRDGRRFRVRNGSVCAGAYDYPDPQGAAGWRKLNVRLEQRAPRQSAAIYRDDGTLVRTLLADAAGVSELWWDGLDDLGGIAGAGRYQVKAVAHDVRVVDDGAIGDNGNPMGAFNCDNADRVVALPDGSFVITTIYDEAGYALRRYSSSGQPVFAANLAEKDYAALAAAGEAMFGVVGKGAAVRIVRLALPGRRVHMANGEEAYAIFAANENAADAAGLAVVGSNAYVAAAGLNVVRVIDLATGRKTADWAVPAVGDIACDTAPRGDALGALWVISGKEVVLLGAGGRIVKRYPTGLDRPRYLAAGHGRLAVVDRESARIALLDSANGRLVRTLGKRRPPGAWVPVSTDLFRQPRAVAFLPDGRLVVTEQARVRILWPESGKINQEILSNFMDSAVVHPTRPEYVYCALGAFRADPKTGAWEWLVEEPQGQTPADEDGKTRRLYLGSPSTAVVLDGRPFIVYYGTGQLRMLDVSDPLKPRPALEYLNEHKVFNPWAYSTICFTKGGNIVAGGNYTLSFKVINYLGLDRGNNPIYDFANPATVGMEKDPSPRGMKAIAALASDALTGDIYYLAVTDLYDKMVPAWGADGTGVGRSTPDGKPLWFALSSGGNYMSIGAVNDGQRAWIMAGKSFGGQIDLFDADGLRLTTGNWGRPSHYQIGFVDLRFGVHAYIRPDGKPGAYVEDDAIGRFARCRVEGADTVSKTAAAFDWQPTGAPAGAAPDAHTVRGKGLAKMQAIPRVAGLEVDGDWSAWEAPGVVPQVVSLPVVGFNRSVPDDLWQTFRAGTSIGALAHDGKNFYVYFVMADDTMHFDSVGPGAMWMYDSVELWMEEEQFGLGFVKDGTPALFKYRFHNREGKQWSAGYALPRENIWGAKIDDLSSHPLGRQLATIAGVSFLGRKGYAVMGRIPFDEVKLVGGIAGRGGKDILNMTGRPGEVVRVGIAFGAISSWGREQDYKVNWPSALMFSDPTRSAAFVLGP